MSKVYVTQEVEGRNFLPARKFGSLVAIMPPNSQVVLTSIPTIRKIRRALNNFSDEDYLLLSGDPIIMGLSMMIASEMNRGRMKLLKWDKRLKEYHEIEIDYYHRESNNG